MNPPPAPFAVLFRSRALRHLLAFSCFAVGLQGSPGPQSTDIVEFSFDVPGEVALAQRVADSAVTSTPITLNNLGRNSTKYGGDFAVMFTPSHSATGGYSVARSLDSGAYFSFSVTVGENQVLSLSRLDFQATAGGEGTRAFYVFTDRTGLKPGQELFSDARNNGLPIGAPLKDYSVRLDSLRPLQGLRAGQSVEFRVYVQTSGGSINFDDIRLFGVLSPE